MIVDDATRRDATDSCVPTGRDRGRGNARSDDGRRAVAVEMGGRGTTSGDGGGGFSSKIMGLKVGARRAREGGGEREGFFCRARDKA